MKKIVGVGKVLAILAIIVAVLVILDAHVFGASDVHLLAVAVGALAIGVLVS